ncbi:hypothetical protein [Clostridium folliculivorans]|uniref:Uncharacterized protein n=1 Tax=Clostridium folliculivorans TaxID=2886038 RepID=A0A9W5Y4H5_9CLOT|nr:hypothetical protein [Clostridium folliculivorans]GKU26586.1 hypothetical protein CFOLD11_34130 [Clostridium folliculivorans]GKU28982.1 hypothetical protein CFB3_10880 [Clostridium folliculivorans]
MKEVFLINTNYKTFNNEYEINGEVATISILKKNGEKLSAKIDASDVDKVKECGVWFAEWNKDFNDYIVENISSTKKNKQAKPLKQSLQSVVLDVNPKAPIKHKNGDTLDNTKANLEIVERNTKNEFEIVDEDTAAILLKDKYGKVISKALISRDDIGAVVTDAYSWVFHKVANDISVIANTPEGRVHLDKLIMNPAEGEKVHHINLNPLDNRRKNLENTKA